MRLALALMLPALCLGPPAAAGVPQPVRQDFERVCIVDYEPTGSKGRSWYQEQVDTLSAYIAHDVGGAWAYAGRSYAYFGLGEVAAALADVEQAIRLEPGNGDHHNRLAWTLYLIGRPSEGLEAVERALSLRPHDKESIDTLAHIYAALGQVDAAIAAFERSIAAGDLSWRRMYEQALRCHGYDPGPIDGIYDEAARAALVACITAGCRVLE